MPIKGGTPAVRRFWFLSLL